MYRNVNYNYPFVIRIPLGYCSLTQNELIIRVFAKLIHISRGNPILNYLIIADPRHFHVIREGRLRPHDRRSVPPDDLDISRTIVDFRGLAT